MKKDIYGVYGASGFGREVMPVVRAQLESSGVSADRVVFIDDNPGEGFVNGHQIVCFHDFMEIDARNRYVSIAIASGEIREELAKKCIDSGAIPLNVIAQNVISMDDVEIGEGAILSPFVTITSNVKIGKNFHANIYSYVAHDCVIGDFVTFAPAVRCNGNVLIEDHAYIGTGAIIKQGRPGKPLVIGRGAVIGMGAVVTKDVPPGLTVVGNPARPLQRG